MVSIPQAEVELWLDRVVPAAGHWFRVDQAVMCSAPREVGGKLTYITDTQLRAWGAKQVPPWRLEWERGVDGPVLRR